MTCMSAARGWSLSIASSSSASPTPCAAALACSSMTRTPCSSSRKALAIGTLILVSALRPTIFSSASGALHELGLLPRGRRYIAGLSASLGRAPNAAS